MEMNQLDSSMPLHVYLYILATSPVFHDLTRTPSSARSTIHEDSAAINVIPATPGASNEACW
jgi:hypothetical protein